MTPKERAAMQQALEALEKYAYWRCTPETDQTITALREALAERSNHESELMMNDGNYRRKILAELDIEEMTLTQIAARHEQAEQEPVAIGTEWKPCMKLPVVVHVREQREGESHVSTREGITPVKPDDLIMRGVAGEEYPIGRELFNKTYTFDTAAPVRTKDLTDDEIYEFVCATDSYKEFARAVIAADREKNK